MKLAKLSLAAIAAVSLSTGVFAADSLSSALTSGKVSGTLQTYYFNTKKTPGDSENILDLGLDLSYTTAAFNGFTAGFTFQGTNSPWATDSTKLGYFNSTMYGTGAVLSQAYLQYANSGAFIKAGRQYISTPLVAGSGSRITKESFEGYVAGYTGLSKTVIAAGYVTKMQRRTDGNGGIGQFSENNVAVNAPSIKDTGLAFNSMRNAYTIFATNNSVKGLKLTGAYAHAKFDVAVTDKSVTPNTTTVANDVKADIWYGEAAYTMPINSINVGIAGQVYNSSTNISGDPFDNTLFGLKLSASANGLSGFAAYTKVNDNGQGTGGVIAGIGNGTGLAYTNSFFASHQPLSNDEDAYAIGLGYNFAKVGVNGLKAKALYNKFNVQGNNDANSYGVGVYYAFAGNLKGLGTSVEYEKINNDAAADSGKLRVKLNYKF